MTKKDAPGAEWELSWVEGPGEPVRYRKLEGAGYAKACQEAKNLRFKLRDKKGARVWIAREF